MANIEFDRTDPRSPDYDRVLQAQDAYQYGENAYEQAKYDFVNSQSQRLRAWPPAGDDSMLIEDRFTYVPSIPPNFYGGENALPRTADRSGILPLNTDIDPNAAYGRYANLSNRAYNIDNTWKSIANMGSEDLDAPGGQGRRDVALSDLSEKYLSLSKQAESAKQEAMFLDTAYNRQIGIETFRGWDPEANELAGLAEQNQRDLGRLVRERTNKFNAGIPISKGLDFKIELAQGAVNKSLGNWDDLLQKKAVFQGPKGPYLLSGVPLQFLDDMSDKAAFNLKRSAQINSEKVQMFQSKYANDAAFRASVNQGLKAKVPGVLAAGLGGYMVKQKMDEGESLPAAVGQTAGEIVLNAAKFALYERFVGQIGTLGAPEVDPYAKQRREDPMFGMSPIERQQRLANQREVERVSNIRLADTIDKVQMDDLEADFPGIKKEEARVAKILRERREKTTEVETNILNSPFWNKSK